MLPRNRKISDSPLKNAFYNGLSTFLALVLAILFYFLILRLPSILDFILHVFSVLRPAIYGFVIAYLINPLVRFLYQKLFIFSHKIIRKDSVANTIAKVCSVLFGVIIFLVILGGLCWLILPTVIESVMNLINTIAEHYPEYLDYLNTFSFSNENLRGLTDDLFRHIAEWLTTDFKESIGQIVDSVYSGALGVLYFLKDFIIGVMIAVYLLYSKSLFKSQLRKVICALFRPKTVGRICRTSAKADKIFGGFIIGKLIDSLVIGILCFIGVSVLGFHSCSVLVAFIVGVTNIIPVFGPYIGAIPSALIVWVSQGRFRDCIYFVIFIIILQQIDGNIIGPKILGDSTGLSSFWVIIAIVVFGGFFGVFGMLIGVPCFALLYFIVSVLVRRKLAAKHLPTESTSYRDENFRLDNFLNNVSEHPETEPNEEDNAC